MIGFKRRLRVRQHDETDCGAACLMAICRYYRVPATLTELRMKAGTTERGTNFYGMMHAAKAIGFDVRAVKGTVDSLPALSLPAIAHMVYENSLQHFVVLCSMGPRSVIIMDPGDGKYHNVSLAQFAKDWTRNMLLLYPVGREQDKPAEKSKMGRVLEIIRPHRPMLAHALFGALLYALLGTATAFFVQKVVDDVLSGSNSSLLNFMGIAMVFVIVLRALISGFKTLYVLKVGQLIDLALIPAYHKHLLRLPLGFFNTMKTGEIMSRITDAVKVRMFVSEIVLAFSVNTIMLLIAVSLMFSYYWKLGALMLMIVPFYLGIYLFVDRLNRRVQRRLMEQTAGVEAKMVENIQNVALIRHFSLERHFEEILDKKFSALLETVFKSGSNSFFAGIAAEVISQGFTLIVLWVGAHYVIKQELSPGELMSFYTLTAYFTSPVSSLIGMNKSVQEALISGDRLLDIIDLEPESDEESRSMDIEVPPLGCIRFEKINFSYGVHTHVFKDLDLEIPLRKMTVIVGESGSGKSTLISLLHDIYPLESGNIVIADQPFRYVRRSSIREKIAVVPQQTQLFSGTLIYNIAPGVAEPDMKLVMQICQDLGMLGFIEQLQRGFSTILTNNGSNLSGGQRQRVAIARALYRQPQILVMDEATSSLDPAAEEFVYQTLRRLVNAGTTVILVAHRLQTVKMADHIVVLYEGRLAECGSHDQLLAKRATYFRLWQHYLPINLN